MHRRYLAGRFVQVIPLVLGVVIINFVLVHLTPGDPASALAGDQAPQEYIDQLREKYGLDDPIFVQLWVYLGLLAQGDLGYSFSYQRPVTEVVLQALGPTLLLLLAAELPAIVIGTLIGAYSARRHRTSFDHVTSFASLALYSIPVFVSGMLLILLLAQTLHWFPTSGMTSYGAPSSGLGAALDVAHHLVLPALTFSLFLIPTYIRLARASVLEVMREDYVTTARAIGYSENAVFFRHALRNALLPTITIASISLGLTFSGALLVETVFAWPGMGQLMYNAVFQRDYPVLMGVFLITAICVALASLLADAVYARVDPRVSYG